jgi:hypothetical protein
MVLKVQIDWKEDWARIPVRCHHKSPVTRTHNFTSRPAVSAGSPCSAASFEVNSEPHTGARPLARLCVGLIKREMAVRNRLEQLRQSSPGVPSGAMVFMRFLTRT